MDWRTHWDGLQARTKDEFVRRGTILSYEEYLEQVWLHPAQHLRNSAQYLRDVLDFYGSYEVQAPTGAARRWRIFDAPFGQAEDRVVGQEAVQARLYRILSTFVRGGRVNKLVMLYGPNGSAKSLIVRALMMGLEDYAQRDEGVAYSFNWVFPSERVAGGAIGFTTPGGRALPAESFAYLSSEQLDARVPCELHDHPLFLLPASERAGLIERLGAAGRLPADAVVSDYLRHGELCHKCRRIFEAMLANYEGDLAQTLRHVQIERLYLSRRYRRGAVTVEPQLTADAHFQQVTADRSLASLPRTLQHVALYEPSGALVDANRGLLEFSDMLKRPIDHFKYLLSTIETATVAMDSLILYLDEILIATTNDKYLEAFKAHPDFPSFKGRLELVRVPYLRRLADEVRIYDDRVNPVVVGRHIAPHAVRAAAAWGVLTRLLPPLKGDYPAELRRTIAQLSPAEKLALYDRAETPPALSSAEARALVAQIPRLFEQYDELDEYEGRIGASARELRALLLAAGASSEHACLHPLAVLEELRRLAKQQSLYEYLRVEAERGYHAHEDFVGQVEEQYLEWLDREVQGATGLAAEERYGELFTRYVTHVSHWTKGERLEDPISGQWVEPDAGMMAEVEKVIRPRGEEAPAFRRALISKIGAWALEHHGQPTDYGAIFGPLIEQLREDFFMRRRERVRALARLFIAQLEQAEGAPAPETLDPRDVAQARAMLPALERLGYCRACARDSVSFLLRRRYAR